MKLTHCCSPCYLAARVAHPHDGLMMKSIKIGDSSIALLPSRSGPWLLGVA